MKIELNKEYTTRDGRPVRIYAIDAGGLYPIHGATLEAYGEWKPSTWAMNGNWDTVGGNRNDLIEVRETMMVTGYFNVYPTWYGGFHLNKEEADKYADEGRIACVKINMEVEKGQYDE